MTLRISGKSISVGEALRDRVSERERFFISWRYLVDAEQAWDKALDLAMAWTQTYPREAFAFNSLGLASGTLGQHERAATAFRQALALDGSPETRRRMERAGVDVVVYRGEEISLKGDGGPTCLTRPLLRA